MPDSTPLPLTARIALGVLRITPKALILGISSAIGQIWYVLSPGRRRIAAENLQIAFGEDMAPREQRRVARASFRGLIRVFGELAIAPRLLGPDPATSGRLRFVGDWQALREDVATGRGGLIVTGHLGSWELGGPGLRAQGVPLRVMARPVGRPVADALLETWRGGPEAVIPKVGGLSDLVRHVRRGDWVALVADQNAGRHGVFVPVFGLEASTYPTAAALAERLHLPLYMGCCLRQPGRSGHFDVHVARLEPPPPDAADPVEARLHAMTAQLEAWIRLVPEQYNWAHRRWKTRPPGRDRSEPGQPAYARLWPTGQDGAPAHGRPIFDAPAG